MPAPLALLQIIGGGATVYGIGSIIKNIFDGKKADRINSDSEDLLIEAKKIYNQAKDSQGISINVLNQKKIFIIRSTFSSFTNSFRKIKRFETIFSDNNDELDKLNKKKLSVEELCDTSHYAPLIVWDFMSGNPFDYISRAKARANLDRAYTNLAKAKKVAVKLRSDADAGNAIRRRTYVIYRLLIRLDAILSPLVSQMDEIIKKHGKNYNKFPVESKIIIAKAYSIAEAVKTAIDTAILTSDGKLNNESALIMAAIHERIEKIHAGEICKN